MNDDDTKCKTLAELASELEAMEGVHATVHTTPTPMAWVEIIVDAHLIGSSVLRRISEHKCGIVETSQPAQGRIVAIVEIV